MTDYTGFFIICLLLALTPGPDVVFIVTQGATLGSRNGAVSAAGVEVGVLAHIVLASLGLAALAASSPAALDTIRILGAVYLIYLGINEYRRAAMPKRAAQQPEVIENSFGRGFIVNLTNPKMLIFMYSFFPQFMGTESSISYLLMLCAIFFVTDAVAHLGYGVAAGELSRYLLKGGRRPQRLGYLSGSVFLGLGVASLWVG